MNRKFGLISVLIAVLILISGCATSIDKIKSNPSYYVGKEVRISGDVILEANIPFMDFSIFHIDDGSGSMFLISSGEYNIGDRISTSAKVIGVGDKNTKSTAAKISADTSAFLTEYDLAPEAEADKLGKKLYRLILTLGGKTEGSYFLISE